MNHHRRQHNPNNNARNNWSPSSRPSQGFSKRQQLESELRVLENQLVDTDELIDAAYEKGQRLALALQQHEATRPFAVGVALVSAFGVRLPPIMREWQYRKGKLDDQMRQVQNHCTDLASKRRALDIKITRTRDAIADLQFEP